MRKIISRNPFSGKINQQFDYISQSNLQQALKKAEGGYQIQLKRTIKQRGQMIENLGMLIDRRKKMLSETITIEMGKPIKEAELEVAKVVSFCKYYSSNFQHLYPTHVKSDAKKTLIKYKPLGTVYFLVPFNFPFYLNFKAGLPNLLLGNCLLTRNSDSTPLLGLAIQELMNQVGFDSGQYQNVFTSHDQIDEIMSHNSVCGVSFTGSSRAGSMIASTAGKYLKRSIMELGGNDPFLVLFDANLEAAVNAAVQGRCRNAGQICFSPKRFIIVKEHYEKFKNKLIEKFEKIKYGDPMNPDTEMGPLARPDIHFNLSDQLKNLPASYKVSWQRNNIQKPFFPITIVEGTDEEYDHETFGPVYTLFKAENEEHAIKLANSGTYGLGAVVFSEKRGEQVGDKIRCGMSFVNSLTKSDTTFPSGGVGRSGYGRECGSQGFKGFANIKTYYVN